MTNKDEPVNHTGTVVRLLACVCILFVVWQHAHWSVALVLTLLTIEGELVAYSLREHGRRLRGEK